MTIELQAHGMRYELWLRRSANDGRSAVEHKALPLHVAEVVAAGDPAITDELELRGWVKVRPADVTDVQELLGTADQLLHAERTIKQLGELGAELLRAATRGLGAIRALNGGEGRHFSSVADQTAYDLQKAINAYTDNVAPPEDEPETVSVKAHRIVYPAGSEPLFDRAVLPDELDEDPASAEDATTIISNTTINNYGVQPEGALDASLAGNLRALLVCLDPDAADNLVEPFAVLERITVLVSELEARAADAEQSLSSAAEQLGKEALARVNADRARHEMQDELGRVASVLIIARHTPAGVEDTAAQVRKLVAKLQEYDNEREAARRVVHAAIILIMAYLRGNALSLSQVATDTNDAIHDWLDLQPAGEATSATAEFIEKRLGIRDSAPVDLPSPKVPPATKLEPGWHKAPAAGGITAAEFAEGVAKLPKPPSLPTDGYGNLLRTEETMGTKVANAAMWVLDKLFPKT